jgi:hypothetical protein
MMPASLQPAAHEPSNNLHTHSTAQHSTAQQAQHSKEEAAAERRDTGRNAERIQRREQETRKEDGSTTVAKLLFLRVSHLASLQTHTT